MRLPDFNRDLELHFVHRLTGGRHTALTSYAVDLIDTLDAEHTAHAATAKALEHAHERIEYLQKLAGGDSALERAIAFNDYDDEAQATQADEYNALEAAYIATAGEVDHYHAWAPGTLPGDRLCEPNCGACQILSDIPTNILAAVHERTYTETGAQL